MKKQYVLLVLVFLALSSVASNAEIAVGYETLVILPHAFTASYHDKGSGLGLKASSDFGASALSLAATIASVAGTLGLGGYTNINFYTLSASKDIQQSENFRNYIRAGAFVMSGKSGSTVKSGTLPIIGLGMEWQKLWGSSFAFNADLSYPELLTLGLKSYF